MGLAARLPVTLHLSADRHAHLRIEPGAMTRLFCAPAAQATKRGKPLTHPLACATDEGTNATPWQMKYSGVARQHLTHSSTHSRKRALPACLLHPLPSVNGVVSQHPPMGSRLGRIIFL